MTPRTKATIAALASIPATIASGDAPGMERVVGRLNEERLHLWDPPDLRSYFVRSAKRADPRPTRGTSLEYEYPRLEALLAAGDAREQRLIGRAAARLALETNGVLTANWIDVLAAAEQGLVGPEQLARVSSALTAATEAWSALDDATDPGWVQRNILRRRRFAISSLQCAVEPLEFPLDSADAVYEAARALPDRGDVSSLETLAIEILGPDRASAVEEIEVRPRDSAPTKGSSTSPWLGTLPTSWRTVAILVGIGLVAGALGRVAGELALPVIPDSLPTIAVNRVVKIGVIALILFVVFLTRSRRAVLTEAATATTLAIAGWWLVGPLTLAIQATLDRFDPTVLDSLFDGSTGVLPYAPIYAVSTAVAVVGGHLLLRYFRRPN
jgi:hypothetical protein